MIVAHIFGATGQFRYSPKGTDGRPSRLHFHAEPNEAIRFSKSSFLTAFPAAELVEASDGKDISICVRDQKNIIHVLATIDVGDELEASLVWFEARDGSGAFTNSRESLRPGDPLPFDRIVAFATDVNLCVAEDVLSKLGLTSSDVGWLHDSRDSGCFLHSGMTFGSVGCLRYTRTIAGAELSFLIGDDRVPFISQKVFSTAAPSFTRGESTGAYFVRSGANEIIFSTVGSTEPLLVTALFFRTPGSRY